MCMFFIYLLVVYQTTYIKVSECHTADGEFGVLPSTTGNKILSKCGQSNIDPCTFTEVDSLEEAILICHQNLDICGAFSYSPQGVNGFTTGTMNIIDLRGGFSENPVYDTYIQQAKSA